MKVLFVVSECMPFASTGGLAEVASSLPIALDKLAVEVKVIIPLYKIIKEKYYGDLEFIDEVYIKLGWRKQYCGIYTYKDENIDYYFIDNEYYFNRDMLYSYYDDGERFAFYSKSIYDVTKRIGFNPDIIHCHDHQTAMTSIYYKMQAKISPKFVFTIHNIEYQGKYNPYILGDVFGLDEKYLELVEYDGKINLVKTGIQTSDLVTTVSERYMKELRWNQFAHGLHYIINDNQDKLLGILNGINYDFYNSKTDKVLYKNYDEKSLEIKALNKKHMQELLLLEKNDRPMICIISRLVAHKGIDLVIDKIDEIMNLDIQLIVLGSGEKDYNDFFLNASKKYHGLVYINDYNVKLAKQIYSSADFLLMPSKIEPCGLSQMIALRFGTLPIVRATGGLYDSIKDSFGFIFKRYNSNEMLLKIEDAINIYNKKEEYIKMIKNGYKQNFSWDNQAKVYLDAYSKLI